MELKRKRARIIVDISVTLTTVLDALEARIIDLSEHGAQIVGASVPKGNKFQIEYMGHTVYAQCMWSEIDRMGVRFPFGLSDGPMHDALIMATPSDQAALTGTSNLPGSPAGGFMPPPGLAAMPRRISPAFGRRG
ncbi:hypothetical protein BH10PSE13_BH10PSE13_15820 [soil metagenome]